MMQIVRLYLSGAWVLGGRVAAVVHKAGLGAHKCYCLGGGRRIGGGRLGSRVRQLVALNVAVAYDPLVGHRFDHYVGDGEAETVKG